MTAELLHTWRSSLDHRHSTPACIAARSSMVVGYLPRCARTRSLELWILGYNGLKSKVKPPPPSWEARAKGRQLRWREGNGRRYSFG
jgi:hypothetical protein